MLKPLFAVFTLLAVAAFSAVAHARTDRAVGPHRAAASTETSKGVFIVRCLFSHQRQVDPIVSPGPSGTKSGHMHDFFGNRSVDSNSTYQSASAAATTCSHSGDKAGYWSPSLVAPNGTLIKPRAAFAYYRNTPVKYRSTVAFPPDFRIVAGGVGTYPNSGWSCEQDASNLVQTPPYCGSQKLVLHVRFPNCWDGVHTDSANHRSHVAYAQNSACPSSHPVKVPEIFLHVRYAVPGGSGYKLSDGTLAPHADFWNVWKQDVLVGFVKKCLNGGINCGTLTG
jgi:hypothetical protein